jgi:ABC-type dipeptide/oligopeptide/nickel transport system permease subunit
LAETLHIDLDGQGAGPPEGGDIVVTASSWQLALREFTSNRLAVISVGLIIVFVLFSFVGPLIHHTNQISASAYNPDASPGDGHLFGTDDNGFDELGRMMVGGQTALEIGFLTAFIAITVGTLYGAISGLVGGLLDAAMMRFVDMLLSIPFLLIVLILSTKYSATVLEESLVLGAFSWLVPARLVRGEVLSLRERDFVTAAVVMGASRWRLIIRHLVPNAMSVTIVNVTFLIADSIIVLASLGLLGFGLQYPHTSWGDMLGNAENYVSAGEWWLVYPVAVCLIIVVLCCNLIGDALRDATDVRLRRR